MALGSARTQASWGFKKRTLVEDFIGQLVVCHVLGCGLRPVFPTSTRRPFEQITETYHIANVNRFLFNEGFAPANDTLYSNSLEGDFGRFGSLVTYW